MKISKTQKKSIQLNVTSLIDVMFILILFFVVTSTFKDPGNNALDIVLPKSKHASEEKIEPKEEVLFLSNTGKVSFLGKRFAIDSLEIYFPKLISDLDDKTVVLKGDKDVSYQRFIQVFETLKKHNIEKLILAADKE
jgi:biopolymer transport protein ExbD